MNYNEKKEQVKKLKKIIQPKQRSEEWFAMREKMVTASAVADCLGEGYKSPLEFVVEKNGYSVYTDCDATHHGVKYEAIANLLYSEKNNVQVLEFGLLPHPKYDFLGASPDGICSWKTLDNSKSELVGRMLEIKCPLNRKIKTEGTIKSDVPHYYYIQVQIQLDVCGLDECDFLQCKITEYLDLEEYVKDDENGKSISSGLEHGCVIRFLPKNKVICSCCPNSKYIGCDKTKYKAKYLYPPSAVMTIEEMTYFISESINTYKDNFDFCYMSEESYGDQNDFTLKSKDKIFNISMIGGFIKYENSTELIYITEFKNNNTVILSKKLNISSNFKVYYNEYIFDKVLYWKLDLFTVTLIKRDVEWIKKNINMIKKVWDCVLFYKKNKEKLKELKTIYDKYQNKYAKKTDLIKHSLQIMKKHIETEENINDIVEQCLNTKKNKSKELSDSPKKEKRTFNKSLFLDDSE